MQESYFVRYNGGKYLLSRLASDAWYIRGKKKDFKICPVRCDVESAKNQALNWLKANHQRVK